MTDMDDGIAAIVQIDDPEIDRESVYARIREGLRVRGPLPPMNFPTFDRPSAPPLRSDLFSEELTESLERLNATFDQVWVELSLVERRFPVFGALVNRFKRDLHRLVIFYVNGLARAQQAINADVVRAVNRLVADLDAADLVGLRRDLDDARLRLAELERQLARRSTDVE